jgi:hypothetical protein
MGNVIGQYITVAVGLYGMSSGQYLCVKVRMQVAKLLMRGMMVVVGDDGKEKWCRFKYEFLLVFCYTCGSIGHVDKVCSIKLKKREVEHYSNWLKCGLHRPKIEDQREAFETMM